MATLTTTARGDVRAEPRPNAGGVTISVGQEAFLFASPSEARELAELLLDSADAIEDGVPSVSITRRARQAPALVGGAA